MCADVVVERGGPSEGPAAVAALEGPVAGVGDHVVAQLRGLGEGLGAVAALVRPAGGQGGARGLPWQQRPHQQRGAARDVAHLSACARSGGGERGGALRSLQSPPSAYRALMTCVNHRGLPRYS